jgi:hypothetical protein
MAYTVWAMQVAEIPNYQQLIKKPQPPQPDPLLQAKVQTEQAKAKNIESKTQGDLVKNASDVQTAKQLAEIEAAKQSASSEHERTKQAMELQGLNVEHMADLVSKVLEQRHQTQMNAIKEEHTRVMGEKRIQEASKRKG